VSRCEPCAEEALRDQRLREHKYPLRALPLRFKDKGCPRRRNNGTGADGQQIWQTQIPTVTNNSVPDGSGGLIVTEYDTRSPHQLQPMAIVD
jgi:hypothetical protein